MRRYSRLGKKIVNPGAHMPHAAVGLILKKRRKKQDIKENPNGKWAADPKTQYNPYPLEFVPENM